MAAVAPASAAILHSRHGPKPVERDLRISLSLRRVHGVFRFGTRRRPNLTLCFVLEDDKLRGIQDLEEERKAKAEEESGEVGRALSLAESMAEKFAEKMARKKSERFSYLVAAVMSSFGITSMAIMAVYYRFDWHMEGGEVPYTEMSGTFALSVGAAVSSFIPYSS